MSTKALFYKDTIDQENFIGAVTHDGYLKTLDENNGGLDLLNIRTKENLIEYLNEWANNNINYYNEKNYPKCVHVVWNLKDYVKNYSIPNYVYLLKDDNMYIKSLWGKTNVPVKTVIIKKIIRERMDEIKPCNECIVQVCCKRSNDDNNLCQKAYNFVESNYLEHYDKKGGK